MGGTMLLMLSPNSIFEVKEHHRSRLEASYHRTCRKFCKVTKASLIRPSQDRAPHAIQNDFAWDTTRQNECLNDLATLIIESKYFTGCSDVQQWSDIPYVVSVC